MIIGLLEMRVSIPEARSLKDKRSVMRSMKDRVMNKMNFSVAEVGSQDKWQSADLAFVTVTAQKKTAEKRISELSTFLRSNPRYVILDLRTEYL
jgi:hypothetical protein